MDTNKVKEIFSDQAFVKRLFEMETPAEVQKTLKEKGLDFSEKDVMKLRDEIVKHVENGTKPEELSLDQLDDVAGGFVITAMVLATVVTIVAPIINDQVRRGNIRW